MRSIIDNPACWGAWEEPGAPDAPATAESDAGQLRPGSFGAARDGFRAPILFRPSAADMANADTNRAMRSLLDAVSGAALGEAWDRAIFDHIKYGTGAAAIGIADDGTNAVTAWTGVNGGLSLCGADATPYGEAFLNIAPRTFDMTHRFAYIDDGVDCSVAIPKDATRCDVVRLLRKFADAIEQGGDS